MICEGLCRYHYFCLALLILASRNYDVSGLRTIWKDKESYVRDDLIDSCDYLLQHTPSIWLHKYAP